MIKNKDQTQRRDNRKEQIIVPNVQITDFGMGEQAVHQRISVSVYNVVRTRYNSISLTDLYHPYWIISHVRKGRVTTITRGEKYIATTNDVMIHPPHIPFSECADEPGIHDWLMIETSVRDNIDIFRMYPIYPVVKLQSGDLFTQTFERLLGVWLDRTNRFRNIFVSAYAQTLVSILMNDWHMGGATPRPAVLTVAQDRFAEAIKFMLDNADQRITLYHLANVVHLHPNYFHRIFKQTYGVTPSEMLQRIRVERARVLVGSTNEPIESVAQRCGINDVTYFKRVFRKHTGHTVSEYRGKYRYASEGYLPLDTYWAKDEVPDDT